MPAIALDIRSSNVDHLVVTDAVERRQVASDAALARLRTGVPRVFPLEVPISDSPAQVRGEMNLMEDWAYTAGGFYGLFASTTVAPAQFAR